jgi:hypothetical protein
MITRTVWFFTIETGNYEGNFDFERFSTHVPENGSSASVIACETTCIPPSISCVPAFPWSPFVKSIRIRQTAIVIILRFSPKDVAKQLFFEGIISALFALLERQGGNLSEPWLILFPKRTTISK